MEYDHLLELIKTVSNSNVVNFRYEEGETKIIMSAGEVQEKEKTLTQAVIEPVKEGKEEGQIIRSPLVGTFYATPSEEEPPFVKVGEEVKEGQILAIVEAMKLMNDIESEYNGVVDEIFVKNGQTVEYGQPLFRIR